MESSVRRPHQSSSPEERSREHGALPCPGDLSWRTSPEPPKGPGALDPCSAKEVREQEAAEHPPKDPQQGPRKEEESLNSQGDGMVWLRAGAPISNCRAGQLPGA